MNRMWIVFRQSDALEIAPLLSPKPEDAWFTNSEQK